MYNIKQVPQALTTLVEKQRFVDENDSLQKLWDDIVEKKSLEDNDPDVLEFYESDYDSLDTYPRGGLLDVLAT